jgi:signal transduction histidine kinase
MESTQRVIESAEKARHVERTLREAQRSTVVSAAATVEEVVTDARAKFQDSVIEYNPSSGDGSEASVRVVDEQLFTGALKELIENAVTHTDREVPEVTVTVETTSGQVQVSVADRGPGIPDREVEVLSSSTETHLEHSSGLGLWLVKWTASLSSGSLSFTDNGPRGTVVTLTLAAAE